MNLLIALLLFFSGDNMKLVVTSTAFANKDLIPAKYTCDGGNYNPPLHISNIPPEKTKSLAIIVDDPDAPGGNFDHWVIWNIKPENIKRINENSSPGVQGKNGQGDTMYIGPCPPDGTHNYHFKVYALDGMLELAPGATKQELLNAMQGHIVASGELIGTYKKKKK